MTAHLTREQYIDRGLRYLKDADGRRDPIDRATLLAILAQTYLVAASLIPAAPAPQPESGAIETLPLVAKRDKDGDLWISLDGERWTWVGEVLEPLSKEFEPYTNVRIVPLTS